MKYLIYRKAGDSYFTTDGEEVDFIPGLPEPGTDWIYVPIVAEIDFQQYKELMGEWCGSLIVKEKFVEIDQYMDETRSWD